MLASKQPCPQTSSTANTAISNKSTLAQLIKNNAPLIATVAPLMTMANLSMMYTVLSGKLLASQPKHNNAPLMDSKFAVSGSAGCTSTSSDPSIAVPPAVKRPTDTKSVLPETIVGGRPTRDGKKMTDGGGLIY